MSNRLGIIGIVAIVVGYLVIASCVLVVSEYEQVVLTAFGEPVGEPIVEPGLHFILPWYKQHTYSRRLLRWDGERSQIPTKDKRFIWVDVTARWRITDPLKFLQSLGSYARAQTRLDDIIDSEVRTILSENDLIEAVRSHAGSLELADDVTAAQARGGQRLAQPPLMVVKGRKALQREMVAKATAKTSQSFGIDIVDVRLKRINYIDEVQQNIFKRMIAERQKVAEQYRSEGKGRAAEILGRMERQLQEIRSEAYRKSNEIKGEADGEAARIYAEAYSQDPEFYAFQQSLEAYKHIFGAEGKGRRSTLLLSTDSQLLRYLGDPSGGRTVVMPAAPTVPATTAGHQR